MGGMSRLRGQFTGGRSVARCNAPARTVRSRVITAHARAAQVPATTPSIVRSEVSTSTASSARRSGESARFRDFSSRSCISSRSLSKIDLSAGLFKVIGAASGAAFKRRVEIDLHLALGNTTVPMSRPSATVAWRSPKAALQLDQRPAPQQSSGQA